MTPSCDPVLAQLEELYRSRLPHFVRLARAILGDRERALEAVQDGFAGAVSGREGFRADGPIEAWVWRAVVNAARKAARTPLVEVHSLDDRPHELPPARQDLAPLIAALPERQRLVVFLRYYADLDYRGIATALDIEVGTVSATLAAAHATLRTRIQEVQVHG